MGRSLHKNRPTREEFSSVYSGVYSLKFIRLLRVVTEYTARKRMLYLINPYFSVATVLDCLKARWTERKGDLLDTCVITAFLITIN